MLMKGRDLWVFTPNVSQPIRLGLAQRLTGQVANGDLARANFSVITRQNCCVSKNWMTKTTTYSNCWPWTGASPTIASCYGLTNQLSATQGEFYSLSGRLLKTSFL